MGPTSAPSSGAENRALADMVSQMAKDAVNRGATALMDEEVRVDSKDVDLTLVHQLNLAHANLMRTIGRQFRRIWALAVDAVLRVAACVGDKANQGRANRKWGDRF